MSAAKYITRTAGDHNEIALTDDDVVITRWHFRDLDLSVALHDVEASGKNLI